MLKVTSRLQKTRSTSTIIVLEPQEIFPHLVLVEVNVIPLISPSYDTKSS